MAPGIVDEVVLTQSRSSASVLITADKDFGELVFRRRQATTGVLLVRLSGLAPATKGCLRSPDAWKYPDPPRTIFLSVRQLKRILRLGLG